MIMEWIMFVQQKFVHHGEVILLLMQRLRKEDKCASFHVMILGASFRSFVFCDVDELNFFWLVILALQYSSHMRNTPAVSNTIEESYD